MNKKRLLFLTILVVLCCVAGLVVHFSPLLRGARVLGGVRSSVVLSPVDFARLPNEHFEQFAVTEAGTLLLRSDHNLYEADPVRGGLNVVVVAPGVSTFVSMGSNLLVLRGDRLGEVTPRGLRDVLQLPAAGMHLAHCGLGKELCVWKHGDSHLLRLDAHGRLSSWLTLVDPVVGVAPTLGGAVDVATRGEVYRVLGTQSNVAIRPPPELGDLVSVASDPRTGELFFATRERVYAMRGAQAVALTQGLGGSLCFAGSTLYVFDEARSAVVALETAGKRQR